MWKERAGHLQTATPASSSSPLRDSVGRRSEQQEQTMGKQLPIGKSNPTRQTITRSSSSRSDEEAGAAATRTVGAAGKRRAGRREAPSSNPPLAPSCPPLCTDTGCLSLAANLRLSCSHHHHPSPLTCTYTCTSTHAAGLALSMLAWDAQTTGKPGLLHRDDQLPHGPLFALSWSPCTLTVHLFAFSSPALRVTIPAIVPVVPLAIR